MRATSFTYDTRGRLLSKTPDASLNKDPITFSYPNELTKVVTRGTNTTTYRTDLNRGWLNAVENSGVVDGRIEYSYDAAGNKTSVESVAIKDGIEQKNKTVFTYDALGRTDLVTFSDGATTAYGYDTVGNRESFNGRFRAECLDQEWFSSLQEARETIEAWRLRYNGERPHSSLGYLPPDVWAQNYYQLQQNLTL